MPTHLRSFLQRFAYTNHTFFVGQLGNVSHFEQISDACHEAGGYPFLAGIRLNGLRSGASWSQHLVDRMPFGVLRCDRLHVIICVPDWVAYVKEDVVIDALLSMKFGSPSLIAQPWKVQVYYLGHLSKGAAQESANALTGGNCCNFGPTRPDCLDVTSRSKSYLKMGVVSQIASSSLHGNPGCWTHDVSYEKCCGIVADDGCWNVLGDVFWSRAKCCGIESAPQDAVATSKDFTVYTNTEDTHCVTSHRLTLFHVFQELAMQISSEGLKPEGACSKQDQVHHHINAKLVHLSDALEQNLSFVLCATESCGVRDLAHRVVPSLISQEFARQHMQVHVKLKRVRVWRQDPRLDVYMYALEKDMLYARMMVSRSWFEWGSGGSTVAALRNPSINRIVTVDSDWSWLDKLRQRSDAKVALRNGRLKLLHADIGLTIDWGVPVDPLIDWSIYPSAVYEAGLAVWDTFLIDGRFRVACFLSALMFASVSTRILVHDYPQRSELYQTMLKYATLVAQQYTLYMFEPSQAVLEREPETMSQLRRDLHFFHNIYD